MIVFQGFNIHSEIYSTNWYEWNQDTKMLLKFMMLQAQQPVYIKIGQIAPMTLDTFKQIGNTTYKYFTMMQNMRK